MRHNVCYLEPRTERHTWIGIIKYDILFPGVIEAYACDIQPQRRTVKTECAPGVNILTRYTFCTTVAAFYCVQIRCNCNYASATENRRRRGGIVFSRVSVRECVCVSVRPENLVNTISQTPMKGISANFGQGCIWAHRCADQILGPQQAMT